MVSLSDELKERNILKLILIVRFACATFDVGHPIIHLPHYILSAHAGLSASRKEKRCMVQYPGYMVAAACI
jgi:hypothetical protein